MRNWWHDFRASGPAVVFAVVFLAGTLILFVIAARRG